MFVSSLVQVRELHKSIFIQGEKLTVFLCLKCDWAELIYGKHYDVTHTHTGFVFGVKQLALNNKGPV